MVPKATTTPEAKKPKGSTLMLPELLKIEGLNYWLMPRRRPRRPLSSGQIPSRLLLKGEESQNITLKRLQTQLVEMTQILVDNRLMKPTQMVERGSSEERSRRLELSLGKVKMGGDASPMSTWRVEVIANPWH